MNNSKVWYDEFIDDEALMEAAKDMWLDLHPNDVLPEEDDLMCWYYDFVYNCNYL